VDILYILRIYKYTWMTLPVYNQGQNYLYYLYKDSTPLEEYERPNNTPFLEVTLALPVP
jgi:hypothetical protein